MSETGVRLWSTLSRQKEDLTLGPDGTVRIYACGPTVYAPIHIGNARPFVVFSALKRYLERRGLRVRHVSNLTDINDKIYAAAREEGVPSDELARRYGQRYIDDTNRLGLGRPDEEPTVTETMPEIIEMISTLIDKGLAYAADGDVYFRVGEFPAYGKLSGQKVDEMAPEEAGAGKESPLDFALWKANKQGEDTSWDAPWGPGRPGWHIECSAMSEACLGHGFEIHGGGIDLSFPHHENEIAQSEGARGGQMASIWMHNEMLELGGGKMSKSEGNISLLSEVLDEWPAPVVLTFFLSSHYRSKLPFSDERLRDAAARLENFANTLRTLDRGAASPGEANDPALSAALVEAHTGFFAALDDDFGTPGAFAALDELARAINISVDGSRPRAEQLEEVRRGFTELLDVFGLAGIGGGAPAVPAEVMDLLETRESARAERDFEAADAARDAILAHGFEIRDTPDGPQVIPRTSDAGD